MLKLEVSFHLTIFIIFILKCSYNQTAHVYTLQVNTTANVNPSSSGISSAGSGDSRSSSSHRRPDEQALISLLSGGQVLHTYIHCTCISLLCFWVISYSTHAYMHTRM